MKTKEELKELKNAYVSLNKKLQVSSEEELKQELDYMRNRIGELSEDELKQVVGGLEPGKLGLSLNISIFYYEVIGKEK